MGNKILVPSWGCELSTKQGNDARLFPNNGQLSLHFAAAGREPLPTAAGLLTTQTLLDHNQKHHDIRLFSVEVFFVGGGRGKLVCSAVR